MTPLNYNHLYYFYAVATDGSITKASTRLHLKPQTISGQISSFEAHIGVELFDRRGKTLHLSEIGRLIYGYAEEIFQLGDELKAVLKTQEPARWQTFTIGVTDAIPKALAYKLISPALNMAEPVRLICNEGDQDSLLADLAVNRLDLVLTDQPLPAGGHIKAYNHGLAESGFTFFAAAKLASVCKESFPKSLSGQPFLLQGKKSAARQRLSSWFEKYDIVPRIIAEFDDSALMKSFGQEGYGAFAAPTLMEKMIVSQFNVEIIGRTEEIKEHYYAISPDRRLKHPAIVEIVNAATAATIET
ncbi:transcriptional activator NhaR [Motiliproteus sp. MSK22-1]|uniref:transcriptional activator NhaR n=1 Tax=Motiliproteus sp. MSK22-1 TaxID=1897630 RepID=UPI0009753F06|nr:transcriptional activator NhaR [Motiliproteus sp. MSK22-1]OMH32697.1 LysR family transcriptional regulator [Motiliproteus sp. MSK22-1]